MTPLWRRNRFFRDEFWRRCWQFWCAVAYSFWDSGMFIPFIYAVCVHIYFVFSVYLQWKPTSEMSKIWRGTLAAARHGLLGWLDCWPAPPPKFIRTAYSFWNFRNFYFIYLCGMCIHLFRVLGVSSMKTYVRDEQNMTRDACCCSARLAGLAWLLASTAAKIHP